MKKLLLTIILLMPVLISAQGLDSYASYLKNKYPIEYERTIKKHAMDKWKDNYEMVVYEINEQADAWFGLLEELEPDNAAIFYKAIKKWGYKGYESSNRETLLKKDGSLLKNLFSLHCNWNMVKYEFDNQLESKNSF